MYVERILAFAEADSVVTDTQTKLGRVTALKFLHIPDAVFRQTVDGRKDVHGNVPRNGANVGFSLGGEANPLQLGALPVRI